MQKMTLTALRSQLFKVADQVLQSGEPVIIERNGRRLLLSSQEPPSRLARLRRRALIVGDAASLDTQKVSAWHEPENLA